MLHLLLILNLMFYIVEAKKHGKPDMNLAEKLLRSHVDSDQSVDEEYEDLRAEYLAYHTALRALLDEGKSARRSMLSTPCWKLNGICINHNLCTGYKYLTEVPGCKDKLKVCCFVWNQYNVRDLRDEGIGLLSFPWTLKKDFAQGKGLVPKEPPSTKKLKKGKKKSLRLLNDNGKSVALVLYQ